MNITVSNKGVDVSDALRERVRDRLEDAASKYFARATEGHVAVSRSGPMFQVDASIHLPTGALLQTRGENEDAYAAADEAMVHLEKRLRRYKRRMVDQRGPRASEDPPAALSILQEPTSPVETSDDSDDTDAVDPVIVAEMDVHLPRLSLGTAVWELDESKAPLLIFRNERHGGVNVVYRRSDGHIGWVDPAPRAADPAE